MDDQMPELRNNPLTGDWVIMALQRSHRPGADISDEKRDDSSCPFCPGNESITPPEIWAVGRESSKPDSPGWKLRVVPNLYPALSPQQEEKKIISGTRHAYTAKGHHDIVVQTPDHYRYIKDMTVGEIRLMLSAFKRRYRELAEAPYVREINIIANVGEEAGASLEHPHSQIFAIPLVSPLMRDELESMERQKRDCLLCKMVAEAIEDGRLVAEQPLFSAFTPYASSYPYETWFVPHRHEPYFDHASDEELDGLAELLLLVLRGLAELHDNPPYNLYLRSAPCDGGDYPYYHWRMGMIPRLTTLGGFELNTQVIINVLSPLQAAAELRKTCKKLKVS
jgi:UDPglucose--hexose-1-phosphate uridylyltransferase